MRGGMDKILVGCQHWKCVADTKLREQGVYGADLNARATALVAQFGGPDVVLPIWIEKWQRTKSSDFFLARARPGESLQQFLQNQAGGDDGVAVFERLAQRKDLGHRRH